LSFIDEECGDRLAEGNRDKVRLYFYHADADAIENNHPENEYVFSLVLSRELISLKIWRRFLLLLFSGVLSR